MKHRLIFAISIASLCLTQIYIIFALSNTRLQPADLDSNSLDILALFKKRKRFTNAIDIVFTYVNGSDPLLTSQMRNYKFYISNVNRYSDNDGLKYALRSIEKFAPWFRYIYIVTNGQRPRWLNHTHPKIRLISHRQIFPDKSHLPTFNSLAIESHLHRIPGLSQKFLYFNDDLLLGQEVWPSDFYTDSGGHRFRMAWPVPACSTNCPRSWLADGQCDSECNMPTCNFDEGDCEDSKSSLTALLNSLKGYLRGSFAPTKNKTSTTPKYVQPLKQRQYTRTLYMNLYENYLG
jgi:hypothetical protein